MTDDTKQKIHTLVDQGRFEDAKKLMDGEDKGKVIRLRVTLRDHEILTNEAREAGVSLSQYIRQAIDEYINRDRRGEG
jgi:predicted HicB family RNase H-like nuclease